MKTLHSTYFRGFYKKILTGLIVQIISFACISFNITILEDFAPLAILITTIRPLCINNNFYRNIPYIINRPFSKGELLRFYFYVRSIKSIFFLIPIFVYILFFSQDASSFKGMDYMMLYNFCLAFVGANYVLPILLIQKNNFM